MHWRSCSRSIAIGGIGLMTVLTMAVLTMGALIERAGAQQMQQVNDGFNALDPQWASANPFMSSGFGIGSSLATGINQQATTVPFGSGTLGLFAASSAGGVNGIPGNVFGPVLASPTSLRQNWFANFANPASVTSVFGSYKSAPDAALIGLYTTASFGVTTISTNPSGFSGLPNFSGGNDVSAFSARAGLGLQLTPHISIEGSVGVTQVPSSTFR